MLSDDIGTDAETQSRALPHFLRRKERLEDARQMFGRDAAACVADFDNDMAGLQGGANTNFPSVLNRVAGIDQKIHKDLVQLLRIARDLRNGAVLLRPPRILHR